MRTALTTLACLGAAIGCAASATTAPPPRADEPRSVEVADEPIAPMLELSVATETPVGRIAPEHAGEFPVVIDVRNASERPVRLSNLHAQIEVRRDGEPVHECAREREWLRLSEGTEVLRPGEARRYVAHLPCGLERPGEYTLLVDVLAGEELDLRMPAPTADRLATSSVLRVAESRPDWRPGGSALAAAPRASSHP